MSKAFRHFSGAVSALMITTQVAAADRAPVGNIVSDYFQQELEQKGCWGPNFENVKNSLGESGRTEAARLFMGARDLPSLPTGDARADIEKLKEISHFLTCWAATEKAKASLAGLAEQDETPIAEPIADTIFSSRIRDAALFPDKNQREERINEALLAHIEHVNIVIDREFGSAINTASGIPDVGVDPNDLNGIELER